MRAVALAHKLGDLSEMHSLPPAIEERWRSWAATEVLRLTRSPSTESSPSVPSKSVHGDSAHTGLGLPSWANETDIGAPLHALGAFYARVGKIEFVISFLYSSSCTARSLDEACALKVLTMCLQIRGAIVPPSHIHIITAIFRTRNIRKRPRGRGEMSRSLSFTFPRNFLCHG